MATAIQSGERSGTATASIKGKAVGKRKAMAAVRTTGTRTATQSGRDVAPRSLAEIMAILTEEELALVGRVFGGPLEISTREPAFSGTVEWLRSIRFRIVDFLESLEDTGSINVVAHKGGGAEIQFGMSGGGGDLIVLALGVEN